MADGRLQIGTMVRRRSAALHAALCCVGVACASGGGTAAPEPAVDAAADSVLIEQDAVCRLSSSVTVHVRNQGSADVQISFGGYTPARAAPGLSHTTYDVTRSYLEHTVIRLRIVRGGLQEGGPAEIPAEHVVCNDATLIIGARPRYSFFYGGRVGSRSPRP